jgi:hypothetical protein
MIIALYENQWIVNPPAAGVACARLSITSTSSCVYFGGGAGELQLQDTFDVAAVLPGVLHRTVAAPDNQLAGLFLAGKLHRAARSCILGLVRAIATEAFARDNPAASAGGDFDPDSFHFLD